MVEKATDKYPDGYNFFLQLFLFYFSGFNYCSLFSSEQFPIHDLKDPQSMSIPDISLIHMSVSQVKHDFVCSDLSLVHAH